MKGVTRLFLLTAVISMTLLGLILVGCGGGDKEKTEAETTLPEDTGDESLLDTTMTEEPPAETPKEVAQQPKAQPKPVKKTEPPKEQPKPKEPEIIKTTILPENTSMEVTMLTKVSTGENKIGDRFRALVKGPAEKGQNLSLPEGTILEGVIADLNDGKAKDTKALIKLKFTDFILPGEKPIPIEGYVITDDGSGVIQPGGQGATIAKDAGLGAIAGGVIGAVTGSKDSKTESAAKGAAAGAVVGGVAGALLHKDQVTIKENTDIKITVVSPVVKTTVKQ